MDDFKPARPKIEDLTRDERELLETKILPTAQRWLRIPSLAKHGRQTLDYWGVYTPEEGQ